jgi:hypothetical protein
LKNNEEFTWRTHSTTKAFLLQSNVRSFLVMELSPRRRLVGIALSFISSFIICAAGLGTRRRTESQLYVFRSLPGGQR